MATWQEILKAKGKTDAEIQQIAAAVGTSGALFDEIIANAASQTTAAESKLAEATQKENKINQFWKDEATPQINDAFSKVSQAQAEAAFYRTQAEEAKKLGFIAKDAPGFTPNPNPNPSPNPNPNPTPTFTPGANPVPGSPGAPQYMTTAQASAALAGAAYLMTEHQRLFGEPLPDLEALMTEANKTGTKARDVWEKKYNVEAKRTEIAAAAQKAHDDKVAKDAVDKYIQDNGSRQGNENTRGMRTSTHPEYIPKDTSGKPDKMAWTDPLRGQKLRERMHEQAARDRAAGQRVQ